MAHNATSIKPGNTSAVMTSHLYTQVDNHPASTTESHATISTGQVVLLVVLFIIIPACIYFICFCCGCCYGAALFGKPADPNKGKKSHKKKSHHHRDSKTKKKKSKKSSKSSKRKSKAPSSRGQVSSLKTSPKLSAKGSNNQSGLNASSFQRIPTKRSALSAASKTASSKMSQQKGSNSKVSHKA